MADLPGNAFFVPLLLAIDVALLLSILQREHPQQPVGSVGTAPKCGEFVGPSLRDLFQQSETNMQHVRSQDARSRECYLDP